MYGLYLIGSSCKMRAVSIKAQDHQINSAFPPAGNVRATGVALGRSFRSSQIRRRSSSSSPEVATTADFSQFHTRSSWQHPPWALASLLPSPEPPLEVWGHGGQKRTDTLLLTSISRVTVISSEYPRRWIHGADPMSLLSTFVLLVLLPRLSSSLGSLSKSTAWIYTPVRLYYGENAG